MNELDSELVRKMLEERGYVYTDNPDEADVVLLNTCTVREKAARKAKHLVRYFSKREKTTVVMGCLAQQEKDNLLRYGADLVVGTRAFVEIPDLLESIGRQKVVCEDNLLRRPLYEGKGVLPPGRGDRGRGQASGRRRRCGDHPPRSERQQLL